MWTLMMWSLKQQHVGVRTASAGKTEAALTERRLLNERELVLLKESGMRVLGT
jgi:hypothetical protein